LVGQQSGYTNFPCFLCLWAAGLVKSIGLGKVGQREMDFKIG